MTDFPERTEQTNNQRPAALPDSLSFLSVAKPSERGASGSTAPGEESWTYLVNLTANMLPNNAGGSEYKYAELKKLAKLTANSNSQLIVQEFDEKTRMLRRYQVAHGTLNELKPVQSAGTARDLESLLASAPHKGHVALINEGHGNGDLGFTGDAGDLSIADFDRSVAKGLAATGRSKLDLLSLDSCLMANIQTLSKFSNLSDTIVASELEEYSSVELSATPPKTSFDMQPLSSYLSALLQQPPRDGRQAANVMLAISGKNCDLLVPTMEACGTPSLGIYNGAAAINAERALDRFGSQLRLAINDPTARKSIDSLIGQLPDISQAGDHLRDIDTFARGVINLLDSGKLKLHNQSLKDAAQSMIDADSKLTAAFHINPKTRAVQIYKQENLRGLNVFLPGADFDVRQEALNFMGDGPAQTTPREQLLQRELQRSLPDASSGGWTNFVLALRSEKPGDVLQARD